MIVTNLAANFNWVDKAQFDTCQEVIYTLAGPRPTQETWENFLADAKDFFGLTLIYIGIEQTPTVTDSGLYLTFRIT